MNNKNIWNFIFELGQLRKIEHEGWRLINADNIDSVAEHSLRAAQIGFILAKLENYQNPLEVVAIAVFHDVAECRTGDFHKVANRYINADEERAVKEQIENLGDIGKEIYHLWKQAEHKNTKAGIIAKDADLLEQAAMAKEYLDKSYEFAQDWINNVSKLLQTNAAKQLLAALQETNSNDWWQGLKKI